MSRILVLRTSDLVEYHTSMTLGEYKRHIENVSRGYYDFFTFMEQDTKSMVTVVPKNVCGLEFFNE